MEYGTDFLETHTQDGGFLQSDFWRSFQEHAGKETLRIEEGNCFGNGVVLTLWPVGKYLYFPRGPLFANESMTVSSDVEKIIERAKEKNLKWIRIEPQSAVVLESVKKNCSHKIVKAPHDMQPREIFVIDISGPESEILAKMKQKTRYNIRLAEKKGVTVLKTHDAKYREAFLDLIVATADRKVITPHPRSYYEKFFDSFPSEMLSLFVAEYKGEVIAANLLIVFEKTAIYLHGGSSDKYREVMAPYLLQWKQIQFAKTLGALRYDFGGVKIAERSDKDVTWEGITRFKQGFAPMTSPVIFPGAYDIILDQRAYFVYDALRRVRALTMNIKKFLS